MSTDIVACPRCGANLQNSPAIAGQLVACPQCQTQLQMPPLTSSMPQVDDLLPPAAQLPAEVSLAPSVGLETSTKRKRKKSASQSLRRKMSYAGPLIATFIFVAMVIVGIALYIRQQNEDLLKDAHQRIVGNWELADPSDELNRWEFAFHTNGRFQMLVQPTGEKQDLSNGRWSVQSAAEGVAAVRVLWDDHSEEQMLVRFADGNLRIELPSVGSFNFQAAQVSDAAS